MSDEEALLFVWVGEILLEVVKMATAYVLHAGERKEMELEEGKTSDQLQMLLLAFQEKKKGKKFWHCFNLIFIFDKPWMMI